VTETLVCCNLVAFDLWNTPNPTLIFDFDSSIGLAVVGVLSIDFSGVDMTHFESRHTEGKVEYYLRYRVKVDMRTEDGVLRVSCISNGKTIGITTIDFRE